MNKRTLIMLLTITAIISAPSHSVWAKKKNPELMTLDDYEREDDIQIEVKESKRGQSKNEAKNKNSVNSFNLTSVRLGAALTTGSWPQDRTNSTMITLSAGKLLIPAPGYFSLEAALAVSPATPRNFALEAALAGGLIHAKSYTAPHIGFRVGAGRLVVSGRGREFGAFLGPEIGLFPGRIAGKLFSIRARYTWMPNHINGVRPQWYGLDFGLHF